MKTPSELSTLLPSLFSDKPLGKRLKESVIWRVWDKAVGQPIASKARPSAFRQGILTVAVTSAPWMQQLGFLKQQLIEAVNGALGEEMVTEIYLKAGTLPPLPAPPPPVPHAWSGNLPVKNRAASNKRRRPFLTKSFAPPTATAARSG